MSEISGCEADFTTDPIADEDLLAFALFAGVDPSDSYAVAVREQIWKELFNGSRH